jgi:hypothetical protein
VFDHLRREVVLHNDRGIEGGKIYLMDLSYTPGSGWKIMPPLSEALISEMFLMVSASLFRKGTATLRRRTYAIFL